MGIGLEIGIGIEIIGVEGRAGQDRTGENMSKIS